MKLAVDADHGGTDSPPSGGYLQRESHARPER